jgi:hypothetical protein
MPRSVGLLMFEPYYSIPLLWMSLPTYAGIALNRRSDPDSIPSASLNPHPET